MRNDSVLRSSKVICSGLASVTTERTISGCLRANLRAYMPPALQPDQADLALVAGVDSMSRFSIEA